MPFGLKDKDYKLIKTIFQLFPKIDEVVVFGSRAMGTEKPGSDVDLVLKGNDIKLDDILKLKHKLEELPIIYDFDIINYATINTPALLEHIDRHGIQFYKKQETPSEWKTYKLGEITTRIGDGLYGTPKYDENGDIYFINGSNLVNGKIVINSNTQKVNKTEFDKHKKELSDKTILLGINGTIGNVALYNNEKCILGKSAAYLNIKNDFDKQFVRYVLTNEHFQNFIKTNASGTTIKNVGLGLLREYEFTAPKDKNTQTAIAQILTSLDDKIELNLQMNQTLEAMAQAIFKEWCCVDEGIVPEGWTLKKLNDIADVSSSKRIFLEEYKLNGIPFYRGKEVTQLSNGESISTELFISNERYNEIKERFGVPQIGDILITSVGTIGSVWLVDNDLPFYFKDGNVTWVKDYKTEINGAFVFQWLQTKEAKEQIKSVTIGSTQQALTISALKGLDILIPDEDTVSKVCLQLENINAKRISNISQIQTLTQTRDALLPKLMSGKIVVNG